MQKIIICKGLPASGKSTWAKWYIGKNPNTKIINKDSLRAMLDNGVWSHDNEKHILQCRDELIELSILNGFDVIVDDTNLAPKHEKNIRELAETIGDLYKDEKGMPLQIKVDVAEFKATPEECIKRDRNRPNYVGEQVIWDMYDKFLRPDPPQIGRLAGKPECLIVDIDGTLCHMTSRGIYDWDKVDTDRKDEVIADIIRRFDETYIIFVSGRNDRCRDITEKWLADNGIVYNELFMRKDGDMRKDVIVKKEIYRKEIENKYNVLFVLDDRDQTVRGWRDLGLKCLQVADGSF